MPTAKEFILDHEDRIKVLEQHVINLLAASSGFDLDEEIELDDEVPGGKRDEPVKPSRKTIVLHGIGESADVDLYEPTEDQAKLRHQLIPSINLGGLPKRHGLDKEPAEEAYLKGGPYWLYLFDREYVLGLPPEAKQAMFRDLQLDDQKRADNFARDVMKEEVELDPSLTIAARGA